MATTVENPTEQRYQWHLHMIRMLAGTAPAEPHSPQQRLLDEAIEVYERPSIREDAWTAAYDVLRMGDLPALTVGGADRVADRTDAEEYETMFRGSVLGPLHALITKLERMESAAYGDGDGDDGQHGLLQRDRRELNGICSDLAAALDEWAQGHTRPAPSYQSA